MSWHLYIGIHLYGIHWYTFIMKGNAKFVSERLVKIKMYMFFAKFTDSLNSLLG